MLRWIIAPVTDRRTYRRWTYLILGGALLVPYLLFAAVVVPSLVPFATDVASAFVIGGAVTLPVLAGTSLLPAVRALEAAAVRELLGDPAPDATSAAGRAARLRSGILFSLHVLSGGVLSSLSLMVPVLLGLSLVAPFTGRLGVGVGGGVTEVPRGWAGAWLPAVMLLVTLLLFHLVWWTGEWLTRMARRLFGLPVSERIAQLERRAGQLAERNRLARELHDSVGHALSVVSLQAGAARRRLRRDPETAEQALSAIESSARSALDDLDYVLGLLREERAARSPRSGLAELPSLLSATRLAGIDVDADVCGELDALPPIVSREAYRIVQECLTNVLRHAGKVPVVLRVAAEDDELALTVRNPLGAARRAGRNGGGSGLHGITERAEVLGGRVRAGPQGQDWEVVVRLPAGTRGGGT